MLRRMFIILLLTVSCGIYAQEVPLPLKPNMERIGKEVRRPFGEYNYHSLTRRFDKGDTSLTVDHFRCLYYGASLCRGARTENLSLLRLNEEYASAVQQWGQMSAAAIGAWWRLQMILSAVWSSGNGSEQYPFYVCSEGDVLFMLSDVGQPFCGELPEVQPMQPVALTAGGGERIYFVLCQPR